jgi:chemotaxis protein CheD
MAYEVIKVGMAELKVTRNPNRLLTAGLGSCVGICLWDKGTGIGGMAHIMLPLSIQGRGPINKAKFADTALPELVEQMVQRGAARSNLVAKIAGGAQMFNFPGASDVMRIGDRNAEAARTILKQFKIPLLATDTGGSYGRTIELCTVTGKLYVRTVDRGEKVL